MKVVLNRLCCRLLLPFESLSLPSPLSEDSDLLLSGEDSTGSELTEEHLILLGDPALMEKLLGDSSVNSMGERCIATGIVLDGVQLCMQLRKPPRTTCNLVESKSSKRRSCKLLCDYN